MRKTATLLALLCLLGFFGAVYGAQTPTTAEGYFSLAHEAFQKGDLDAVIFNCRMAISMKPQFVDAHYMLGRAYLLTAAKKNDLAIKKFGNNPPETRYLKQYIKGRSELAKAIQHFSKALELNPGDIDAKLNLAIAQDNLGKDDEAEKNYEAVIKSDPMSTQARDAYNNLGVFYAAKKEFKKAKKMYEKAIELDPNFPPARLNLQRLLSLKPDLK